MTFLVSGAEIRLYETSKISYLNDDDGDDGDDDGNDAGDDIVSCRRAWWLSTQTQMKKPINNENENEDDDDDDDGDGDNDNDADDKN